MSETNSEVSKGEATITPTVGSIILFAGYSWRVLDVKDGKALLISKKILVERAYNDENKAVTWETCTLRSYLNGEFYNSLGDEKARISEAQVLTKSNPEYGTYGGADTTDKIFLLSIDEAKRYFSSDEERVAEANFIDVSWWWLRSPAFGSNSVEVINNGGKFSGGYGNSVNVIGGVRPALWIKL
jgi:hypothetical protein